MSGDTDNWFKSWLKPANLIALGALIVAVIGLWGGITIYKNRQVIEGTEGCTITDSEQELSGNASSSQNIKCTDSTIEGVKQKKSN